MPYLPAELLEKILRNLDVDAPSQRNLRHEPSLELVVSSDPALKNASLVCRRWRRLVLPILCKYSCLRLSLPCDENQPCCFACSESSVKPGDWDVRAPNASSRGPLALFLDHPSRLQHCEAVQAQIDTLATRAEYKDAQRGTALCTYAFHRALQDYCDFVLAWDLQSIVRSFTLLTDQQPESPRCEWLRDAIRRFWQYLYSTVQPERIVIVAPPLQMLLFMNASSKPGRDERSRQRGQFHLLELHSDIEVSKKALSLHREPEDEVVEPIDIDPSFGPYSLIHLQPWTRVALNEGSFLEIYGTLEYFEQGPPWDVYSIRNALIVQSAHGTRLSLINSGQSSKITLPHLRSFTYIGVFPFAGGMNILRLLSYLEELDVQFAPGLDSQILDNKDRVGRAVLADCWLEVTQAYRFLADSMFTPRMSRLTFPHLKRVTCRDFQIPTLADELDRIFASCHLPVWAEHERGVYTREAMCLFPETDSE